MEKRRLFIRSLGLGGIAAALGVAAPAVRADESTPRHLGTYLQFLQQQINKLSLAVKKLGEKVGMLDHEVSELSEGNFDELRVNNPDLGAPSQLFFGPTDDCSIEVQPPDERSQSSGLMLRDPGGIRILNPNDADNPTLHFGDSNLCTIFADPKQGLMLRDPGGIRILNPNDAGNPTLHFGDSNLCTIFADPGAGLIVLDPFGLNIQSPIAEQPSQLAFGGADSECRIRAGGPGGPTGEGPGMMFTDPRGFLFENPEIQNAATLNVDGKVVASEFVQQSSATLKENVVPLDDALESIERLRGVRFDWKEDRGGKPSIGFIAEEVSEVFPELVSHKEDGSVGGLAYSNLVAVAVEGIKAQQDQIQRLESEKASLNDEVAELRARLDGVSAQVERLLGKMA